MNRRKFLAGLGAALANPLGDFSTDNIRYKCTERYSYGWTDPKAVFGSSSEMLPIDYVPNVLGSRLLKDTVVDERQLRKFFESDNCWYLQQPHPNGLKTFVRNRVEI